jgi:hypothetical protein
MASFETMDLSMLQRDGTDCHLDTKVPTVPTETEIVAAPRIVTDTPRDLSSVPLDLDWLVPAWVGALRDHSHLSNVLTHISGRNWGDVERALGSIFDISIRSYDLSPLARNIVELLCADRGVTGRIMKPYFRAFLASELTADQARRLGVHVTTLFLELEIPNPCAEDGGNAKRIAVVQGASTTSAQRLFQDIIERWSPQIRIGGMIETRNSADGRTCRAGQLRNIADNVLYPMFQEAGRDAVCDLEDAGLHAAAEAVSHDVAAGCDLTILSKFGKLEAAGQGLRPAFTTAIHANIPLLTYVPLAIYRVWKSFVGSRVAVLPAEALAVDDWLRSLGTIRRAMTCC